ncbi:TIM44-like domain-containing protein [Eubacterium xylanophilum]|uniref:TIM44-like domain-containing protein n=1 Tax=Eubacterium xylanophilum TaxID=39497 RepID=UPI00047D0C5F|nr:TIM44-like domain-containing protein [Eubacterium xylanophilum]
MNKRFLKQLLIMMVCVFALSFIAVYTQSSADFGNYSGHSDYGSSHSSSHSSSSSSDDSGIGAILIYLLSTSWGRPIAVIIIIILIVGYFKKPKKTKDASENVQTNAPPVSRQLRPMTEYTGFDPEFDEAEFRERWSNLYIQMQDCWRDKDIEPVKPYFTDAFFNQCDRQVQSMKQQGVTNYVERIAVLEVAPLGFYQTSDMDHIVVRVNTRIVDYTLDDATGNLVSGDRSAEKFMVYEWDVCRKTGITTSQSEGVKSLNCPHCGAAININQTAKCPYCDSIVTIDNEDWALDSIKGISQRTVK